MKRFLLAVIAAMFFVGQFCTGISPMQAHAASVSACPFGMETTHESHEAPVKSMATCVRSTPVILAGSLSLSDTPEQVQPAIIPPTNYVDYYSMLGNGSTVAAYEEDIPWHTTYLSVRKRE